MSVDGQHQAGMTHLKITNLLTFQGFSSIGDVQFEAITTGTGSQWSASWQGGEVGGWEQPKKKKSKLLVTEYVSETMSIDWDQSQPSMKKVTVCVIQTLSNVEHPVNTSIGSKCLSKPLNVGLHLAKRGCPAACLLKDQFATIWIFIFKFSQLSNGDGCCGFGYTHSSK